MQKSNVQTEGWKQVGRLSCHKVNTVMNTMLWTLYWQSLSGFPTARSGNKRYMLTDEENRHFPLAVEKLSQVSPSLTLITACHFVCCPGNNLLCCQFVTSPSSTFNHSHVMVHCLSHHLPTNLSYFTCSNRFIEANFQKIRFTPRWKLDYWHWLKVRKTSIDRKFRSISVFNCQQT